MLTRFRSLLCLLLLCVLGSNATMAQQAPLASPPAANPNQWRARFVVQAVASPWWSQTLVAAHRGGHSLYGQSTGAHWGVPENSLKAILGAATDGAEIIEVDIRLTSDGVPIVSHDSKWGRETNIGCDTNNGYNPNTNTGRNDAVNSLPLSYVQSASMPSNCSPNGGILLRDVVSGFDGEISETPSTLQQVIDFVNQNQIGAALALDIKDQNAFNAAAQVVLNNKDTYGGNFVDDVIFKVPSTGVSPGTVVNTFNTHKISLFFWDWQYMHIMPVYQTSAIAPYAYGSEQDTPAADPEYWVRNNFDSWNTGWYSDMLVGAEVDLKQPNGILAGTLQHVGARGFTVSNFQPVPETSTGYFNDGSCAPCAQLNNFFYDGVPYGLPSDTDDQRADLTFQLTSAPYTMITTDDYLTMTKALQDNGRRANLLCLTWYGNDRCQGLFQSCNASAAAGNEVPCGQAVPCEVGMTCIQPASNAPATSLDISDELLSWPIQAPQNRVAYFDSWSVYANKFYIKNLDTQGIASRLTTLIYAFENIDPVNLTCLAANQPTGTDPSSPTNYDGASDAYADYQMGFTSANSVDGSTDQWGQPLEGNFNQLKELKAKYPNLKILLSIGGWTYSKFFSDVAATDASRKKFVSSCIAMYINGNLPVLSTSPAGGQGAAAGIFDGFDIDWEFPASANGNVGNHYSPQDTANYTALLAEFRSELNALGGSHMLTAAVPAGPSDIANVQVGSLSQYLDFADLMAYDYHGAFETNGPTNFQAPLFDSPTSPAHGTKFTIDDSVNSWISNGFPANKLNLGIAFYGRGWTGVPDNGTHGLYQTVTGPTAAFQYSQQPGVVDYKEFESAGTFTNNLYFDPTSDSSWVYDGTNFWSIETPFSLKYKYAYIMQKGLGGVMMYSLEDDDANSTLMNAATGSFSN